MDKITDSIILKCRNTKEQTRNDLLQIFLDIQKTNADAFSEKHIKEEMRLFK